MSAQQALIRSGYKAQQIQNAVSLSGSPSTGTQFGINCETDALGLTLEFDVATVKGTGTYASGATALSALSEVVVTSSDKKTVLHDFKTPKTDVPRIAFMFDDLHRRGGYYTADIAISTDTTTKYVVKFWSFFRASDFPLTVTIFLAANTAIYSTVGTGTATVSTIITPEKVGTVNALQSEYSFEFALTGLTAVNNDVTSQMVQKTRIKQLALVVTTESDLTDVTFTTPEVEIISLPTNNMKQFDTDTISGHQTGLFRILLNGTRMSLDKSGAYLVKVNESTADNPTFYLIGDAR